MLFRKLIRHAQMTPLAASIKLHRFVGADSHEGSLVRRVNGSVAMRRAVVRQMKKPMEKSTTRPIREPNDMFRRMITGIGIIKIAISVKRFEIAFNHLYRLSVPILHKSGIVLTGARRS